MASVHVRAHKQAGHMDASDLIKALHRECPHEIAKVVGQYVELKTDGVGGEGTA